MTTPTFPTMFAIEVVLTTTHDLNTIEGRQLHDADRSRILRAIDVALMPFSPERGGGATHVFDHACVMASAHFSMRCKALPPLDDSYRPGDAWNKRS